MAEKYQKSANKSNTVNRIVHWLWITLTLSSWKITLMKYIDAIHVECYFQKLSFVNTITYNLLLTIILYFSFSTFTTKCFIQYNKSLECAKSSLQYPRNMGISWVLPCLHDLDMINMLSLAYIPGQCEWIFPPGAAVAAVAW